MSGNLTTIGEMSGILLKYGKYRGKNLGRENLPKLFIVSCILTSIQVFSGSLFCVKY